MGNLPSLFGGKTQTSSQTTSQQSGSTTNPLAGTILQYGQSNVFPQFSAGNIADTSAALGPNQYQTGAATNQAGISQNVMPVFNSAANMAQNGINPGSIQQWMSPYTQNVIDATNRQADINDGRTLAQAQGSSALAGGLTNSATRGNMDYLRANLANNRNAMAANQYNQGYSTALDSAFKNAGVMNTGAGTAGALAGVQTGANVGAGNLGQLVYGANQNSVMAPYNLTSQGAQTMTGLVPGVGSSYSSSGTGSSTGTSQQNPGMVQSALGALGLFGNAVDYSNKNGGIMNALSSFIPFFSEGGSVMPRFKGNDDQHDKLAKTFHALKGMMNGGSAMPNRFADGGWVTTVKEEPGPARSFVDSMSGGLPQATSSGDGLAAINAQQSALAQFMNNTKPAFPNRFADGGSTISPMSGLGQFSNSLLAASPLAGMADYNAKLQQQRMMEEQNKRQYGLDVGRAMGSFDGNPTLGMLEFREKQYQNDLPQIRPVDVNPDTGQPVYAWTSPQQSPLFRPRNEMAPPVNRQNSMAPVVPVPSVATQGTPPQPGIAPIIAPNGLASINAETVDLSGEEFAKWLESRGRKPYADKLRAIAEGRERFPENPRTPIERQLQTDAMKYDPTINGQTYTARSAALRDHAAGPTAKNIVALNTAARHAADMMKAIDDLGTKDVWGGKFAREMLMGTYSQDPDFASKLRAFENKKLALSEELSKAFHGGPSVTGVEEWKKNFNVAESPAALRSAVATAVKLLEGRLDEVNSNYWRVFNKEPQRPILSPEAKREYDLVKRAADANVSISEMKKRLANPDEAQQKGATSGPAAGPSVEKQVTDRLSQSGKSASAPIDVENAEQARALGSGTWVRRREDGKVLQVP